MDTESACAEKDSDTEIIVDMPTAGIEDAVITEVTEEKIDIGLSPHETEPPVVTDEDQDIDTSASIDEPDNEESAASEDILKAPTQCLGGRHYFFFQRGRQLHY